MNYHRILIITLALMLIFAACGKSNDSEDPGKPDVKQTKSQETNQINVVFNDQEQYSPGDFALKKTLAFISGMRYNAKSTAKHVYVAFANYDATLGLFAVDVPKEPGQIVIVISFLMSNKRTVSSRRLSDTVVTISELLILNSTAVL